MALNDWQRSIHSAYRWWRYWLPAMASFPPAMANFLPATANLLPAMASFPPEMANLLPAMATHFRRATGYHQMAKDFLRPRTLYPPS